MSYRFSVFSLFSISALFLSSMQAYQPDQRQPIGQRSVQPTEVRPAGQQASIVVVQPREQIKPAQAAQQAVDVLVPAKKKKPKKDKSRQPIGERAEAPVVTMQARPQELPSAMHVTVPRKKERHKKDKSRQTLGERSNKAAIIPINQQRQEIGPKTAVQTSIVVPQQVVTPAWQERRVLTGEPTRPIQKAPVSMEGHQPINANAVVSVPAPLHRSERPHLTVGLEMNPATVSRPQRPLIVQRPLPQVIVIDRNSVAYNSATLTPYFISQRGDSIQLDDGSNWKVRERDRRAVRQWNNGDVVVIEAGRFFCWSTYSLVNYTNGTSIDVELINPVCNGVLSHWIIEVNPFEGYLRLQDGSVWRMSTYELLNWNINDDVIIALSKNWFSNDSSYVMINPRAKTRLVAVFNF